MELAPPMHFPLCPDTLKQGMRLKIGGDGDGDVHDGVLQYFGFVVSVGVGGYASFSFQFFFFSKIWFPKVNAFWPRWVKLDGILSYTIIILVCLPGRFFRGARPKF